MLDREVAEQVGDVVAVVDGAFEVVERLLLAQQPAAVGVHFAEQAADGGAVDGVGLLLHLPHQAARLDQRRVAVLAQVRHGVADQRRDQHQLVDQFEHRRRRPLDVVEAERARRQVGVVDDVVEFGGQPVQVLAIDRRDEGLGQRSCMRRTTSSAPCSMRCTASRTSAAGRSFRPARQTAAS
jgi:hypothetical protein